MKISKKLVAAAATAMLLSASLVHASCWDCEQLRKQVYAQVLASPSYPPYPGSQMCGSSVPEQYKAQCIASIDAQRAAIEAEAVQASGEAYSACARGSGC